MVKYELAKIYKIVCNNTELIYIGSTCEPTLARRLAKHASNYKSFLTGKYHYVTSYKVLENNNFDIILIEECPCTNKDQMHARERFYIKTFDCVNKNVIGRTKKESQTAYKENNKEKEQIYRKTRYDENKEEVRNKQKEYYEKNKEKENLRHKLYYEQNKESIDEKRKLNKELRKEKGYDKKYRDKKALLKVNEALNT